ncbi:transporter substrate-binding domain-containing protein [Ensifer sp. SSB1]|uniref:substrate-binding periplasmic protein n=1 Tax=Ensifer sp. SSB1 TaxID=2795385 RepID=UPI001A4D7A92|nr:transporter substrate-binding domain-containing protein [Ensifer sp. SSB1]MBK5567080.1 amino acid ABC transporter substrate-binding protein [Ensifer sp. SSB1]
MESVLFGPMTQQTASPLTKKVQRTKGTIKMSVLKILVTASLCAVSSVAVAADCATTPTTIDKGVMTVAAYDYPPFSVVSSDGGVTGIDAAIVERAAKANCLEVKYVVMDPAATIQSVISGKADVAIGSWARTEKRSQVMGLSAPTYLDPMGVLSRDGSAAVADFEGKSAGTIQGFQWVADLQKVFGSELKLYPNAVSLAQDLESGRVDVAFDSYSFGVYSQQATGAYKGIQIKLATPDERVKATLQPSQGTILYTKDNESLGEALDQSIGSTREAITDDLQKAGFDKSLANVGEPRMVK